MTDTFDPFGFIARHLWKLWGTPAGRNILIMLCYVAVFLIGVHGVWLLILDSVCVVNFALWGRSAYRQRQARLARERHQACLSRIATLEAAMNTSGVPGVVTFTGWDVEQELARREAVARQAREASERLNRVLQALAAGMRGQQVTLFESGRRMTTTIHEEQ